VTIFLLEVNISVDPKCHTGTAISGREIRREILTGSVPVDDIWRHLGPPYAFCGDLYGELMWLQDNNLE